MRPGLIIIDSPCLDDLSNLLKTCAEEDRFSMTYVVVSCRHRKIAAGGAGVVVMYDYHNGMKTAIPEGIRKRSAKLKKI